MMSSSSVRGKIFDFSNNVFLIGLSIATLYPFLYVAFASVSDPAQFSQHRGILWRPLGFTLESYRLVFMNPMLVISYLNTLLYVVIGTALNMTLTILGAYGLSRNNAVFVNPLMMMIVFTMFFSGGLIPTYILIDRLGMMDTIWAVILPNAVSTWNLIVMRTAFQQVPFSLQESAKIDGANDFTVLFRLILPLSKPVIAVMVLFYAVAHWNAYFNAMIYLRTRDLFPLQLILREILITDSFDSMTTAFGGSEKYLIGETIQYATIVVAILPILFLYPFLQKYFVKGVMIGAIKE
ncbi:MAG: sugar transporter permease [Paenibacillus sp.]|jgi:putative aldouronate transport system permease protein|nr:sugar transporter permease [Paenibacillus sp.]